MQNYKITPKIIFNLAKKFLKILRYKSKIKDAFNKQIYIFQTKYIYLKNAEKLLRRILLIKVFSKKSQFENKLLDIKKIIEEKSDLVLKIEHENNELRKHYEYSRREIKSTLIENETLREKLKDLEDKLKYDDVNFKDLFNKNLNDIKSKKLLYLNLNFLLNLLYL